MFEGFPFRDIGGADVVDYGVFRAHGYRFIDGCVRVEEDGCTAEAALLTIYEHEYRQCMHALASALAYIDTHVDSATLASYSPAAWKTRARNTLAPHTHTRRSTHTQREMCAYGQLSKLECL